MIALDTNVLVRVIVDDDEAPDQSAFEQYRHKKSPLKQGL